MYWLETANDPIVTLEPTTFTNAKGELVGLDAFALPASDRQAVGIWSLESDPVPDRAVARVVGVTDEKRSNVVIRHWSTRPLTEDEQAELVQAATDALAAARDTACKLVDALAGEQRARYITVTAGQEMTYQEKVRQAEAFNDDASPDESKYPLIYGEVDITAPNAAGVAAAVLQSFSLWQVIGAAIEKVRLAAKRDIGNALDQASIDAIVAALVWPSGE
ncbi:MAG: hypothetical protein E6R08_11025 [Nevskiaceae bacterium]|nr:MAG: hypothetical protein E6R08_11025 [Nevskiaceae bacterium]